MNSLKKSKKENNIYKNEEKINLSNIINEEINNIKINNY